MNQRNLLDVDWSKIPAPKDDGGAAHLKGVTIPKVSGRWVTEWQPAARIISAKAGGSGNASTDSGRYA